MRHVKNGIEYGYGKRFFKRCMKKTLDTIIFGGGCFWCTEAVFSQLRGVILVTPGYAGGKMEKPTYEDVCEGNTGHAEVIKIEYDPNEISLHTLLEVFFASHDPTTLNRQGNDVGEQYRSVILYATENQRKVTEEYMQKLGVSGAYKEAIVTRVEALEKFFPAEEYHKKYFERNLGQPYCSFVIGPKIKKLHEKFSEFLKSTTSPQSKGV